MDGELGRRRAGVQMVREPAMKLHLGEGLALPTDAITQTFGMGR